VLEQLAASIEKVFLTLDADGNGLLDIEELKAGFASMVCNNKRYQSVKYFAFFLKQFIDCAQWLI
jgi:hypothetical protein